MRKLLPVLISLIFLFIANNCFCQGLGCDIDIGCWLSPDYKPTLPASNECHAKFPSTLNMYAKSSLTTGEPCPINWDLEIRSFDYNTSDCFINGCHKHQRISDPSQYKKMLTSIGGIKCESGTFSNSIYKENRYFFAFDIAKPEASGTLYLLARASIPPGCWRDRILEFNPGWRFENDDPNSDWIWTTIALPYQVSGLVELQNGEKYLKSSNPGNHVSDHQFYSLPKMITNLQKLATQTRAQYEEGTTYKVKISFNDLSLEYGGIFDYGNDWDCNHRLHREGKSADLNTTQCLTCDTGQSGCENKSSLDQVTLKHDNGTQETITVKALIDGVAEGLELMEFHNDQNDGRIHLEFVPTENP